jgi:hypothetical protein
LPWPLDIRLIFATRTHPCQSVFSRRALCRRSPSFLASVQTSFARACGRRNGKRAFRLCENKFPVNLVEKGSKRAPKMSWTLSRCEKPPSNCHSEQSEESAFPLDEQAKQIPRCASARSLGVSARDDTFIFYGSRHTSMSKQGTKPTQTDAPQSESTQISVKCLCSRSWL